MIYKVTRSGIGTGQLRVQVDRDGNVIKLYAQGAMVRFVYLALESIAEPHRPQVWSPEFIAQLIEDGFAVAEDRESLQTNEKIALWIRLYQELKGQKWVMCAPHIKLMEELPLDEALLRWYLDDSNLPDNKVTWLWKGKQTIPNLYHNYNLVLQQMRAPTQGAHPNYWSVEHSRKLNGLQLSDYFRHLKSLGLVSKRNRDGSIADFIPATP